MQPNIKSNFSPARFVSPNFNFRVTSDIELENERFVEVKVLSKTLFVQWMIPCAGEVKHEELKGKCKKSLQGAQCEKGGRYENGKRVSTDVLSSFLRVL